MGKFWQKVKKFLSENLNKKLKKIVAKFGKFLTTVLGLSLSLVAWLCAFITIGPIAIFLYGCYAAGVAFAISAIVDVFKNGNNHIEEPQ